MANEFGLPWSHHYGVNHAGDAWSAVNDCTGKLVLYDSCNDDELLPVMRIHGHIVAAVNAYRGEPPRFQISPERMKEYAEVLGVRIATGLTPASVRAAFQEKMQECVLNCDNPIVVDYSNFPGMSSAVAATQALQAAMRTRRLNETMDFLRSQPLDFDVATDLRDEILSRMEERWLEHLYRAGDWINPPPSPSSEDAGH